MCPRQTSRSTSSATQFIRPHSLTSDGLPRRAPPSLSWDLGMVVNAYAQAAEKIIAEIPGGFRGHQILATVTQKTVGSQAALAEQIAVDRSILVRPLDALEKPGSLHVALIPRIAAIRGSSPQPRGANGMQR